MLINRNSYGYSAHKKYVTGRGFVDSFRGLTSNISSYLATNKDLIAKPMLSAIGSLGALGLTTGVPALLHHIINKKNKVPVTPKIPDDPKYKEILDNLTSTPTVTNLIGSGIKQLSY